MDADRRAARSGFFPATQAHADYVLASLLSEAAAGHFSADFLLPAARPGLMQQIASSIAANQCPTHRGVIVQSYIYVYLQEDRPIAFSWVLASEIPGEYEVYLFSVSDDYRGRGIGKLLLEKTLAQFAAGTRFKARVYNASDAMRHMLISLGFRKSYKQSYGMVHLTYTVPHTSELLQN